jgi:hypothetical protein
MNADGMKQELIENINSAKRGNYNQSVNVFQPGRRFLPLPGGEGWGEGERKSNKFMASERVQTEQETLPVRASRAEGIGAR